MKRKGIFIIISIMRGDVVEVEKMKWIDMASYGMCIHDCVDEEIPEVYRILKDLDRWELCDRGKTVACSEKKGSACRTIWIRSSKT